MPYSSNSKIPASVRRSMTKRGQTIFRKTLNSVLKKSDSEKKAFAVAHSAVNKAGERIKERIDYEYRPGGSTKPSGWLSFDGVFFNVPIMYHASWAMREQGYSVEEMYTLGWVRVFADKDDGEKIIWVETPKGRINRAQKDALFSLKAQYNCDVIVFNNPDSNTTRRRVIEGVVE